MRLTAPGSQAGANGICIGHPWSEIHERHSGTERRTARAIEISVHTLRNWEQARRRPDGPAIALLRIAARHPTILRENLKSAAC